MSDMSNDVAIIGVGLHSFGRFDKTAKQMGAEAIQSALTDAGAAWKDIPFVFRCSHEGSSQKPRNACSHETGSHTQTNRRSAHRVSAGENLPDDTLLVLPPRGGGGGGMYRAARDAEKVL